DPLGDGNKAPARALEVIKKGLAGPVDQSLRLELDGIVELGETDATQNLIRNFFLAEKYKKGTSKVPAQKIAHAAVIGAGVMGRRRLKQLPTSWKSRSKFFVISLTRHRTPRFSRQILLPCQSPNSLPKQKDPIALSDCIFSIRSAE